MPISPFELVDAVVAVPAGAAAVELELLLDPQAASTKAPKLAAPALPAIFRKRLRSRSSRTRRSTIPAGCGADSSVGGLDILCDLRFVSSGRLSFHTPAPPNDSDELIAPARFVGCYSPLPCKRITEV